MKWDVSDPDQFSQTVAVSRYTLTTLLTPRNTYYYYRFPLETPMLLIRWWTTQSTTPNVQATLMRLHTTYLRRQHGYLLLKGKNAFHCVEELLRFHRIMHSIHFAHATADFTAAGCSISDLKRDKSMYCMNACQCVCIFVCIMYLIFI